jgi:hypothetical protein
VPSFGAEKTARRSTSPLGVGVKLLRKVLLSVIMCILATMTLAWGFLLSTICNSPAVANPLTQNTVPYNCHGSILFISPFKDAILDWGWVPFVALIFVGNLLRKWQPNQ